jgi:hypothetical protein
MMRLANLFFVGEGFQTLPGRVSKIAPTKTLHIEFANNITMIAHPF